MRGFKEKLLLCQLRSREVGPLLKGLDGITYVFPACGMLEASSLWGS